MPHRWENLKGLAHSMVLKIFKAEKIVFVCALALVIFKKCNNLCIIFMCDFRHAAMNLPIHTKFQNGEASSQRPPPLSVSLFHNTPYLTDT
jgi:hypothetical protein